MDIKVTMKDGTVREFKDTAAVTSGRTGLVIIVDFYGKQTELSGADISNIMTYDLGERTQV